jgi:hypothetical protein
MKIYTGYFGKLRTYQEKGLFTVSIARGNFKYGTVNYKELSLCPSWAMLKRNYSREEYEKTILGKVDPAELIKKLKKMSGGKDIVLLCYEKDHTTCHRSFVSDWLNSNGIECQEYGLKAKQGNLFY